ncbi:MAG: succinate dehydrogenase, hydrophobic membrane anchor protein [Gammaproteobacteria bacterium]|nr:succinate dehydrogenase, hydrophobic membrane anchor protein [Gammaproteobacteria bacterium]
MSLRNLLDKVFGTASVKNGVSHWLLQRLSAVALVPLTLWFLQWIFRIGSFDYHNVRSEITVGFNYVWLVLLLMTLAYHSALGVQVVIEDYLHAKAVKKLSLFICSFVHIIVAVAGICAVMNIVLTSELL